MLSYKFSQEEKTLMIRVAEHEAIEEMLKLNGKSVFSNDEAIYLAKRIAPYNWSLARRIEDHPGLIKPPTKPE